MEVRWLIRTLVILGLIVLSSCLKNDELNLAFESYQPVDLGDGLIISTPETEHINAAELMQIYNDVYTDEHLWSLRSLLVFRNGKLIAEAYPKDKEDITNRHLIWSCTKQVMGVLTGIAMEEGFIEHIDDPLSKYLDAETLNHPDKQNISIRDLLTMESGIDYNNNGLGSETDKLLRQKPDNSVAFILDLPVNEEPGTVFHYNDGNPHLISAIIQKEAGKPTDRWAEDVFFSKIEVTNYDWVRYKDGITLGGFGIETTPREMAKVALCINDSGRWKGQQVVDPDWIHQMLTPHVLHAEEDYAFGFLWWIDTSRNVYYMDGHGGQFAFIVPEKDLVIVMTAFPNTQGYHQILVDDAMGVVDRISNIAY